MKNSVSFTFNTPPEFNEGIKRLANVLGFNMQGGITVTAEAADHSGISMHGGRAVIYYTKKHQFFRQLGILFENAEKEDIESRDDSHFTEVSIMIDASFGGVPTVKTVSNLLDRLALMGYNMAMLYTEDTVFLESRPYFGYMRGRYSAEELRAMDDYAWEYGIELIPCIECYGHMSKYLRWGEAAAIKDTASVLLAREDKTFEFLEELITKLDSCFRSKRIHIGMDEAWDMGRGKFLDKHGIVPRFEIFNEYMERLTAITDKLGLKPMMWSDMYFRVCSENNEYYDANIEIPEAVCSHIPKNTELIFWHYGEEPQCDDYMLKKHKALGREIIYAGGLWDWMGHFPEHNYMMESVSFSLNACRSNDVHRAMVTLWEYGDGDLYSNLFGMSYFAEKCYDPNITEEKLSSRFAATCDGNRDAFYTMSLYHNRFENESFADFNDRFFGKPLFYQDLMEGLFDMRLWERPMSSHYEMCAEKMAEYTDGTWSCLYSFATKIFKYLALKTRIHETLVPAYRANDNESLRRIAEAEIPSLKEMITDIHGLHREKWHKDLKPFSWRRLEDQYAGMESRCDTARWALLSYLSGKCDSLPQLEEPRLYHPLCGFYTYPNIVI